MIQIILIIQKQKDISFFFKSKVYLLLKKTVNTTKYTILNFSYINTR